MKKVIVKLPEEQKKAKEIEEVLRQYGVDTFIRSYDELGSVQKVKVESQKDIESLKDIISKKVNGVLVETSDWRVIPFENIIAQVAGKLEIYAEAKDVQDALTLKGVLERGVDYVIISPRSIEEALSYVEALNIGNKKVALKPVVIKGIKLIGEGSRVCVDTVEMLNPGEGMLVGSFSSFLFLVHAEVFASKYTSPRPFRVNAGAVHSYILVDQEKTMYLSEIKSGDKVLVSDYKGNARIVFVGRSKLERRPMVLIMAESEGLFGTVILQYAETVSLVREDGKPIAVTEIKEGDKILAMTSEPAGRHFGLKVKEEIKES